MEVKKRWLSMFIALAMIVVSLAGPVQMSHVFAEGTDQDVSGILSTDAIVPKKPRTVMLYAIGADLETGGAMASFNLKQALEADFGDSANFIVMTGGSKSWNLEQSYTVDADGNEIEGGVSEDYNQLWYLEGKANGKMVLLDGDGVTGDGEDALLSKNELMTDPETLSAFINFCVANFPADKYDLILWDHGGGPQLGYGLDEHYRLLETDEQEGHNMIMPLSDIVTAIANNDITDKGQKFDFVNFDACLMSNLEISLALANYCDYMILSSENEPGYGQNYDGWLNYLGQNPDVDTQTLGRKLVDDMIAFYEAGSGTKGEGDPATLSLIDSNKLLDSKLVSSMQTITEILNSQDNTLQFYDEIRSAAASIHFSSATLVDLGIFAEQLGVDYLENTSFTDEGMKNAYTEAAMEIDKVLSDEDLIYARNTRNMNQETLKFTRNQDGSMSTSDQMSPSGLSIYFDSVNDPAEGDVHLYVNEMREVIDLLPKTESFSAIARFLESYRQEIIDYSLILSTGRAITEMAETGTKAEDINWNTVKAYLGYSETQSIDEEDVVTSWSERIEPLLENRDGKEAGAVEWLNELINQQKKEMPSSANTTVQIIDRPDDSDGTQSGYRVTMNNTFQKNIASASASISGIPKATEAWISEQSEDFRAVFNEQIIPMGLIDIDLGTSSGESSINNLNLNAGSINEAVSDWMNSTTTIIDFNDIKPNAIVAYDEAGKRYFTTGIYDPDDKKTIFRVNYENKSTHDEGMGILLFDGSPETAGLTASKFYFMTETGKVDRSIPITELTDEYYVTPIHMLKVYGKFLGSVPVDDAFTLNKSSNIRIGYVPAKECADKLTVRNPKCSIKDIYGATLDLTDKVKEANADGAKRLRSIRFAIVQNAAYTGSELKPLLMDGDKILKEGKDYTLYPAFDGQAVNPGTYEYVIRGNGDYSDITSISFTITPGTLTKAAVKLDKTSFIYNGKTQKPNVTVAGFKAGDYTVTYPKDITNAGTKTINVTGKGNATGTVKVTYTIAKASVKFKNTKKTLKKKKKRKFKTVASPSAVNNVTYKVTSKPKKAKASKIKVSRKGIVTVKKKAAKGTYKVKLTVRATSNWKKATKTITIIVK